MVQHFLTDPQMLRQVLNGIGRPSNATRNILIKWKTILVNANTANAALSLVDANANAISDIPRTLANAVTIPTKRYCGLIFEAISSTKDSRGLISILLPDLLRLEVSPMVDLWLVNLCSKNSVNNGGFVQQ